MQLRFPAPLRSGDRVAVVSPAGPVRPEHVRIGLETLASWGLDPTTLGAFERHERGYLAGVDTHRCDQLVDAWTRDDIAAIFCARGGYGTMRILSALHERLDSFLAHPKLLVGFSDITALHLWLAGIGIPSIHGPVAKSFALHENHIDHLQDAVFGRRKAGDLCFDVRAVTSGRAQGTALGGNLSIVASMLASPLCPDLNGKVLVLEDIGEVDYRLDRLFTSLRISEKAHAPAAIVLGDFSGCGGVYVDDSDIPAFVEELAAEFDCPVVADFPTGHSTRNIAFPMGVEATVDADAGIVQFFTDAVSPADA